MKGKLAETIWARSGQGERPGREQLGGSGGIPPGNFENLSALRRNLVHFIKLAEYSLFSLLRVFY